MSSANPSRAVMALCQEERGLTMLPPGVSVTMIEPRGPVNVGHMARLVKNFGVKKLYIVEPKVDFSVAAVYAAHASKVLDDAVVASFARVRKENELLVATTAVRASKKSNVIRRTVRPEVLHSMLAASQSSSLVFGRDTTGLTNKEIGMCDVTTTIDTTPEYRALNIGHAAAIILYLASRSSPARRSRQSRRARDVFARSVFELAEASRVSDHKTKNLLEASKRIAASSMMTDAHLNLLSGVLRKGAEASRYRGSKT